MRHIPETVLRELLARWKPLENPEYRFATCWSCGRKLIFGMYHVPFHKHPADCHLCRKCFKHFALDDHAP